MVGRIAAHSRRTADVSRYLDYESGEAECMSIAMECRVCSLESRHLKLETQDIGIRYMYLRWKEASWVVF